MIYISKGDWFDKGTQVKLIDDYRLETNKYGSGLFEGLRNGKPDEEICSFDKFYKMEN